MKTLLKDREEYIKGFIKYGRDLSAEYLCLLIDDGDLSPLCVFEDQTIVNQIYNIKNISGKDLLCVIRLRDDTTKIVSTIMMISNFQIGIEN